MRQLRWGVYALLAIAALTVAVNVKLWLSQLENPFQTVYRTRTRTVYVEAERDKKAEKPYKRVTVPCRPVQVLEPDSPDHRADNESGTGGDRTSSSNQPYDRSIHPEDESSMTSRALHDDLLGIFRVPPLPEGGSARVTLDEAGAAHLEVKPKPRSLFELGRLREIGAWGGVRLDDPSRYTWALAYQQDLLRVGPAMLRGRVEYGDEGFGSGGKAELGIAIRF